MTWTTPVVAGDELFSLSAGKPLRCLLDEIEAVKALLPYAFDQLVGPTTLTGPIVVNAGDDATSLFLWNNANYAAGWRTYNRSIDGTIFGTPGPTIGNPSGGGAGSIGRIGLIEQFDDPTDPGTFLSLARARELAGLPQVYELDFYGTPTLTYGYLRSRRHRRIGSYDATADNQGNPSEAGQRAWGPTGELCECVAPGEWQIATVKLPTVDVLDNTLARPWHNADANPVSREWNTGSLDVRPSAIDLRGVRPGTILGPDIFEERRLILAQCTDPHY